MEASVMARLVRIELTKVDLPFRHPFRHAAAARSTSESLFLKCVTEDGAVGFGECLPRRYVTGETRDGAFALLECSILPRLVGMEFDTMEEVRRFLEECDGKAPWLDSRTPQSAAWCAVDLALLDVFGRALGEPVRLVNAHWDRFRYSGVVSAETRSKLLISLIKLKLYGIDQVKLKVDDKDVLPCARLARLVMGRKGVVRVDANMAWDVSGSLEKLRALRRVGIACVEQPLDADDLEGAARLVRETDMEIIADESFSDCASLERLIEGRACTGVNVRISKCGGLIAAARRCDEAFRAGLTAQIGCQVGESSLLSAAQLILIPVARRAQYFEGCYGRHLLRVDPVRPCLQLGYAGRPPRLPRGVGLGVQMDEPELNRWVTRRAVVSEKRTSRKEQPCH
jgi:muconate cycloisomerase